MSKFGIFEQNRLVLGTQPIGSVFPLNQHELMATTLRNLYRFEGQEIKQMSDYQFSAACYIEEANLIIGHTCKGSEMTVLLLTDMEHPVVKSFPTQHAGVYHILYSSKSRAVITIGSGVKVFNFKYKFVDRHVSTTKPDVTITLRASFAEKFDTFILNPPVFDKENEWLFIPTPDGIRPFDLNGNPMPLASKLHVNSYISYAFWPDNRKFLTADCDNGVCLWNRNGSFVRNLSIAGGSVVSLHFIDKENVVYVTSRADIFIMNVKTSRTFHCYTATERPTRVYPIRMKGKFFIGLCTNHTFHFLRIHAPWMVWAKNVSKPRNIVRFPQINNAARVVVHTYNSFAKLFAPRNGKALTAATPSDAIAPISYYYDRGIFFDYEWDGNKYIENYTKTLIDEDHDFLFMLYDDGQVVQYNARTAPCSILWKKQLDCNYMVLVMYQGNWAYALANIYGFVLILDYITLEEIKAFSVAKTKSYCCYYCKKTNCMVLQYYNGLTLFDLNTGQILCQTPAKLANCHEMHGDILYFGFENGEIIKYQVLPNKIEEIKSDIVTKPHSMAVTSFSFSSTFYLSCSFDCTILLWSYSIGILSQITIPFPIYSIEILNGKRDFLIGLESEIMVIRGNELFDDADPEIVEIDNYDRLDDPLDPEVIALKDFVARKEKEDSMSYKAFDMKAFIAREKADAFKNSLMQKRIEQARKFKYVKTSEPEVSAQELAEIDRIKKIEEMKKLAMAEDEQARIIQELREQKENENENENDNENENEGGNENDKNANDENKDKNGKSGNGDEKKAKQKSRRRMADPNAKPGDFLKNAFAKEAADADRPKKKKKKKVDPAQLEEEERKRREEEERERIEAENSKNLLQQLNSMMSGSKIPKNEVNTYKSVELDISKMSFSATDTSVPKDTDGDATSKKKKRRKTGYDGLFDPNGVGDKNSRRKTRQSYDPRSGENDSTNGKYNKGGLMNANGSGPSGYGGRNSGTNGSGGYGGRNNGMYGGGNGSGSGTNDPNGQKNNRRRYSVRRNNNVNHLNGSNDPNGMNDYIDINDGDIFDNNGIYYYGNARGKSPDSEGYSFDDRAMTPSPIRWGYHKVPPMRLRAKTPRVFNIKKIFKEPSPNIIIDADSILELYGRGHKELLPVIERLKREGKLFGKRIPTPGEYPDFEEEPQYIPKVMGNRPPIPLPQGHMRKSSPSAQKPKIEILIPFRRRKNSVHSSRNSSRMTNGFDSRSISDDFSIDDYIPGTPRVQPIEVMAIVDPFCPKPPSKDVAVPAKKVDVRLEIPMHERNGPKPLDLSQFSKSQKNPRKNRIPRPPFKSELPPFSLTSPSQINEDDDIIPITIDANYYEGKNLDEYEYNEEDINSNNEDEAQEEEEEEPRNHTEEEEAQQIEKRALNINNEEEEFNDTSYDDESTRCNPSFSYERLNRDSVDEFEEQFSGRDSSSSSYSSSVVVDIDEPLNTNDRVKIQKILTPRTAPKNPFSLPKIEIPKVEEPKAQKETKDEKIIYVDDEDEARLFPITSGQTYIPPAPTPTSTPPPERYNPIRVPAILMNSQPQDMKKIDLIPSRKSSRRVLFEPKKLQPTMSTRTQRSEFLSSNYQTPRIYSSRRYKPEDEIYVLDESITDEEMPEPKKQAMDEIFCLESMVPRISMRRSVSIKSARSPRNIKYKELPTDLATTTSTPRMKQITNSSPPIIAKSPNQLKLEMLDRAIKMEQEQMFVRQFLNSHRSPV